MPFSYERTIRFADTDAAGVVFFANYLSICHEAYEESLIAAGIELDAFFRDERVIVPIARCESEYLRPLKAGDRIRVRLEPKVLKPDTFEIRFEIVRLGPPEKAAGRVRTEHVCLSADTRQRTTLPPGLARWAGVP
jgi:1,4-dihydroxy-2-naphthoyl-CoA hydrolase